MKSKGHPNSIEPARLVIGRQPVLEALKRGVLEQVFMQEGIRGGIIASIAALAHENNLPVARLSRHDMDRLTGDAPGHQGVAANSKEFSYYTLQELIKMTGENPFFLLLDHLQDPQNFGSIIRTASAAGVHGIIIPEKRSVRVTAAVRKVAAGAVEKIKIALIKNLSRVVEELQKEGFWVYGLEAAESSTIFDLDYSGPLALVIGSEGKGLSSLVRKKCDRIASIPMKGSAGSLNAAVASALVIYEAASRREGWRIY